MPDTELETTLRYERYFNRFFRLLGGVDAKGAITTGPLDYDSDYTRGVFGLMYKLRSISTALCGSTPMAAHG